MSICERCGTQFQPQAGGEVVSTRVLCPACTKARAEEKLRAKAAATAGVRNTDAPSSPAARPATTAAKAPSGVTPKPALQTAPRPTSPPPVPSRKPAPRPAARVVEAEEEEAAPKQKRVRAAEREKKTMMIGWAVTAVVAVLAAIVVMIVVHKNQVIADDLKRVQDEQNAIINHLRELNAKSTVLDSQELLAAAEKDQLIWKGKENESEIITLQGKAKSFIEHEKQHSDLLS